MDWDAYKWTKHLEKISLKKDEMYAMANEKNE